MVISGIAQSQMNGPMQIKGPIAFQTPPTAGGGTFGSVITNSNTACASGSATCAVTLTATTAGSGLVAFAWVPTSGRVMTAGSTGGTWAFNAGCQGFDALTGQLSCGTVPVATGGITSITFTLGSGTASGTWTVMVYEIKHTGGTLAVDGTPTNGTNPNCGTADCIAPSVTISGTNDVVVSAMAAGAAVCTAAAPFTNVFTDPSTMGGGAAVRLSINVGTGATFSQGSACPTTSNHNAVLVTVAMSLT